MTQNTLQKVGAIGVAVVMVLVSVLVVVGAVAPAPGATSSISPISPTTTASTNATSTSSTTGVAGATPQTVVQSSEREAGVAAARAAFLAQGGNLSDFFPPSVNVPADPPSATGGHVVPLYANVPAPMGIADYGLRTGANGQIQPYVLNTKSVEGTFTTSDPYGVQTHAYDVVGSSGASTSFGAQLNVIETNVTLKGSTGFGGNPNDMWLQNVIGYNPTATTNQLSFDLNIWNFSYNPWGNLPWAGYADFQAGTILHGYGSGGTTSNGELYSRSGSSITVAYPFTVDLYLNTTVGSYAGSPLVDEVYFNYSVYNSLGQHVCPTSLPAGDLCSSTIGGSYDNVYFNSVTPVNPTTAQIQANGYHYAGNGNGTNLDMEFDFGIGSSDAEVSTTQYANALLNLYTLNATTGKYQVIPSAYDFGSETGEATQGSYGTYSIQSNGAPIEQFRTGPSILTALWNASGGVAGAHALNYANVEPENAFVAIAPGASQTYQQPFKVDPTFGWFNRPTPGGRLGPNTWLQPGIYTVEVMLSGYNPVTENVNLAYANVSLSITLTKNPASTTYTPLWAFSNAELANLAVSGSGTLGNPYILWNSQQGSMSPVFGDQSQWPFLVWDGIYMNQTTAYAQWAPLPSLQVTYPSWELPYINNAPPFSPPSPTTLINWTIPLPPVNKLPVYLLQVQNLTIADSKNISAWFGSGGTTGYSVIAQSSKNLLFFDNTFNVTSLGLDMISGNSNVIFGNTFIPLNLYVQYPGVEHPSTGLSVTDTNDHVYNNAFYTNSTASSTTVGDYWNVSCQPGYSPSAYYGGSGGVACRPATYSQVVNGWTLTGSIEGLNYQGGNFWFNYGNAANPYQNVPYRNRASTVTGSARLGASSGVGDQGDYAPLIAASLYTVSFTESGLPSATTWNVTVFNAVSNLFVNTTSSTTSNTLVFYLPNGTYSYDFNPAIVSGTRYAVGPPAVGTFTVAGSSLAPVSATFSTAYLGLFTESGLATGSVWGIAIAGQLLPPVTVTTSATTTKIGVGLTPGTYSYTVRAVAGYTTTYSGSLTVVNTAASASIAFTQLTYTLTFTETGLPSSAPWFVKAGSTTQMSTGSTDVFTVANGTYVYNSSAGTRVGYAANPAAGTVVVSGGAVAINVPYGTAYSVTFTQTGLPPARGTGYFEWTVNIPGQVRTSSATPTIVLSLPSGSYNYSISSQSVMPTGNPGGIAFTDYTPNPSTGTLPVAGAPATMAIVFSQTLWPVTFSETGLPAGTTWNVTTIASYGGLGNVWQSANTSKMVIELVNSTYGFTAAACGYVGNAPTVNGLAGSFLLWGFPMVVNVTFVPVTVTFVEAGLPQGAEWAVTYGGKLTLANSNSLAFPGTSGTFSYSASALASGWSVTPTHGTVTVAGNSIGVPIQFSSTPSPTYAVYFTASGFQGGTAWQVWLNSTDGGNHYHMSGATPALSVMAVPDSYTFQVGAVAGYTSAFQAPAHGSVTVSNVPLSEWVVYTLVTYTVTFTETGLPGGTTWALIFGGVLYWSATSTITFAVAPGTYAWQIAHLTGHAVTSMSTTSPTTVSGTTSINIGFS